MKFGCKDANGYNYACNRFVFKKGDFVNVSFTFDIHTDRQGNNVIHLYPQELIQMASREAVVSDVINFRINNNC